MMSRLYSMGNKKKPNKNTVNPVQEVITKRQEEQSIKNKKCRHFDKIMNVMDANTVKWWKR